MTTNAHGISAGASSTAAADSCPICKEGRLRRSRRKRDDGAWHRLFFSAYRCRDCRARIWRFNGGRFTAVAVIAAVVLTFGAVIAIAIAIASGLILPQSDESALEPTLALSPTAQPGLAMPSEVPTVAPTAADPELSRRAEQGDPQAQSSLALVYLNGQGGVTKDMQQARKWAEGSALQGDAVGQHTLGLMHLSGLGMLQDYQTAFTWFEKAARQNHADAQYRLGVMYRSGYGTGLDKTKAYVWFNIAAAQGHGEAIEARDRLLPTMTADQVALAQREAQTWRSSGDKP